MVEIKENIEEESWYWRNEIKRNASCSYETSLDLRMAT